MGDSREGSSRWTSELESWGRSGAEGGIYAPLPHRRLGKGEGEGEGEGEVWLDGDMLMLP